jgi:hypothetical protein
MGSGDTSCSSCTLNKTGAPLPRAGAALFGLALGLMGFFLRQRAKS